MKVFAVTRADLSVHSVYSNRNAAEACILNLQSHQAVLGELPSSYSVQEWGVFDKSVTAAIDAAIAEMRRFGQMPP